MRRRTASQIDGGRHLRVLKEVGHDELHVLEHTSLDGAHQ
jgi:hypothetical protein